MKKLVLCLFLLPLFAQAQTIPNASFETWVTDPSNPLDPNAQIPTGWKNASLGGVRKVTATPQDGSAAMNVRSGNVFGDLFPSILYIGLPANTTSRYLNGYIRKTDTGVDTISITAVYYQGTTGTAGGSQETRIATAQWRPFSIEIYNSGSLTPDSMSLLITTRGAGNGFDLDNFSLSNTPIGAPLGAKSGIKTGNMMVTLSPNPAIGEKTTLTVLHLVGRTPLSVRVVDILGKTVWATQHAVTTQDESFAIQTAQFTKGLYHIVVENAGRRSVVQFVKN